MSFLVQKANDLLVISGFSIKKKGSVTFVFKSCVSINYHQFCWLHWYKVCLVGIFAFQHTNWPNFCMYFFVWHQTLKYRHELGGNMKGAWIEIFPGQQCPKNLECNIYKNNPIMWKLNLPMSIFSSFRVVLWRNRFKAYVDNLWGENPSIRYLSTNLKFKFFQWLKI